jgi:hypothetical protein
MDSSYQARCLAIILAMMQGNLQWLMELLWKQIVVWQAS